jgi:hypothetical protein
VPGDKEVKVIVLPNNLYYRKNDLELDDLCRSERRWVTVLLLSGVLGAGSGLLGLILSGLTWFGFSDAAPGFGHLGTWLVAIFFPLIFLSAHALDKIGEARKAIRIAQCRKQEL